MRRARHGLVRRAVALALSWVFMATTVWASAPPLAGAPEPAPKPAAPLLQEEPAPVADPTTDAARPPAVPIPCEQGVFGPKRYTRTTGAPNVFTDTVAVPAWVVSPYALKVVNGEADGSHRVSSARIQVNGAEVARPSDFNQNVPGLERSVTLTPQTTLVVTLESAPASYLTINLCGQQGDKTPPQLAWTEPGPVVTTPTPHLALQYDDVKGPADPLASGVDVSALVVTLDGIDRTALFTKGPSGATADVPADLALSEGLHALTATIKDLAGNAASAQTSFTVSARPPELFVDSPKSGDYMKTSPAEVRGRVVGDPGTVIECRAGAATVPGTRSGPGTEAAFTCALPLAEGGNTIEVVARDRLGHETTVSVPVTLDTKPPKVTIGTPQDDSWTSMETVEVTGHVEDDSPIRTVTVNNVGATLTGSEFRAPQVPVGTGTITATAEDTAGNAGEAAIQLHVDRGAPTVVITKPEENTWVRGPQVEVIGTVGDPEGSPVVVEVNGHGEKDPLQTVPRTFTAVVDAGEGPLDLVATARDEAGNPASTPAWRVYVDFKEPVITLREPKGRPITNGTKLHVEGSVSDISPCKLTIGGESVDVVSDGRFSADVSLTGEGELTIPLVATDSVELTGTLDLRVIVDHTPPDVQIVSPGEGDILGALPVVVQGTVDDEPRGLAVPAPTVRVDGQLAAVTDRVWTITFLDLPDGPHKFTAVARDAADNASTPVERKVVLDLYPPVVTITDPSEPVLTRAEKITIRGTVESRTAATVTLRVNGGGAIDATVTGSTWLAQVPLAEGENTIVAVATSASGKDSDPKSVLVTRDSTAPTVTVLQTPDTIGRNETGRGHVDATDNLPGVVVQVLIKKPGGDPGDGEPVGPPAPPPYDFDIVAPPDVADGATLVVTAVATDKAGNESPHVVNSVQVAAGGVVVGQVLSDETGLPVPGATVVMETASGQRTAQSDARGAYSFPAASAARVRASQAGMIPVERAVVVAPGVGTVVLDVRLTRLAEAVEVGPAGLVLPKVDLPGPVAVQLELHVPQDAVAQPTKLQLTPLSGQGLPGLLPLGWSPLAAFDVRADGPVAAGVEARLQKLPQVTQHLVRFDTGSRAWTMVQPGLVPTGGALTLVLDGTGSYALVVPDPEPAPAVPEPPGVLPGVAQADLPATAVGQGAVEPSVVPPTGGTASGRLFVLSPTPLPSGTAVQAEVTEDFELASGQKASEEVRREDILIFRAPLPADAPATPAGETVLHAVLPVTASRTFETAELLQGKVHLDVLAGRESVRGETGGNRERTVQSGDAILSVPASSLAEDTAVSLEESSLSSFLPAEADVEPLAEVVVDFAGAVLGTSAGLSVACVSGTCTCSGGCAGDTLLVARVERVLGIPRLLVVALAAVNAGRIAAVPTPGLAGIREGGRYVFYRVGGPAGWLSGPTTLADTGAPVVGAVVESDTLPFIARSGMDLPYRLVARPGTAQVKGTKPGTRLAASATAAVVAGGPGEAVPLPLVFAGVATSATVTPADGTQGVAVSVQVEVEATAPLNASADNLANARLSKGAEPVAVRYQLSLSGKRLAVIPVQPLATSTEYTFTAAGLLDAAGDDVLVASPVVFRTKDFVPPVFNVDAIVFSYPEGGMTRVTAPEGSLPSFSEVLVLNTTNGAVLWLQVDGNGCLGCVGANELPASIDDRLLVTITDPAGNVVTFERSKFVKADGTVAIGPGGGTVVGTGGVELRVPSGALEKGVELKAEGVSAEELQQQFPGQVPNLGKNDEGKPAAHLAGGLKLTSKDEPTFKKPIDLVFPLPDFTKAAEGERPPPDKPEDAYYYVVRRVEGPCADGSDTCAPGERRVVFQTIDHAFVECPNAQASCEASEKKVVTASWPFGGYLDSYGIFMITPAGLMMQPVVATYAFLMWTYTQDLPGQALPGVITGKVLRAKWNFGTTVPEYEVVKDKLVVVSAVGDDAQPLMSGYEEITYASPVDGTFTLWDPRYTGGTVRVAATITGVPGDPGVRCPETDGGDASFRCATAYESDPVNWKTTGLRFHRNIATVNITFPAVEPPLPPPAIGVTVYRTEGDKRVATGGIVPSGTPVILAIQPSSELITVQQVLVQGVSEGFRADPLKGQDTGADWIVEYTPATVGTYRVEVSGLGPNNLGKAEQVTGGATFRVIGAGGTDEVVDGQPPRVIEARTVPKDGATGVQVSTYAQVVFTEPVKNISGNVTLRKVTPPPPDTPDADPTLGDPIAVKLSGVLRYGGVVEDLDASPDAVITSLTVQPTSALEYGKKYRLDLADGIKDLDTTETGGACAPARCLVPYTTSFTTFTPESLSQNPESFGSPGIVILGERAYLVENHFHSGTLRVFETTDPVNPQEIPNGPSDTRDPRYTVSYRPVDLVGESDSPITGGRIVAVATGPTAQSKPSNIWLLNVSDDSRTDWIGAVSLTKSAQDGFINRTFLRAGVLYSATYRKGIQVVDLGLVTQSFKAPGSSEYFPMVQEFLTDNRGYGLENVVNIPVDSPFGGPARLNDIEAALMQTREGALVLVGAAGDPGLTVVNPAAQSVLWNGAVKVERDEGGQKVTAATLRYGQAIAMGNVSGSDLVVLVGTGTIGQDTQAKPLLMVVKLEDPSHPVGLGYVQLDDATIQDVILKDDQALLGGTNQVTLVSLADPTNPTVLGTVQGVGGRLAIGSDGAILFGTAHSVFGGTDVPLGGVRTAALGIVGYIPRPPVGLTRTVSDQPETTMQASLSMEETVADIPIKIALYPATTDVTTARLEISNNGILATAVDVALSAGKGFLNLLKGFRRPANSVTSGEMRFYGPDGVERKSARRLFDLGPMSLRVDSNNDTVVDYPGTQADRDDQGAEVTQKAFAFWEAGPLPEGGPPDLEKNLVDWATLQIRLGAGLEYALTNSTWPYVVLRMQNSVWQLWDKQVPVEGREGCPAGKAYLCDETTAHAQAVSFPKIMRSDSQGQIQLLLSPARDKFVRHYLIRCSSCQTKAIEIGQLIAGGAFQPLDNVAVDIKPFPALITALTARSDGSEAFPEAAPNEVKSILDGLPAHYLVRNELQTSWEPTATPWAPLPEGQDRASLDVMNILVHGYAVSETAAVGSAFPTWFKRLYWVGHPVLREQKAHTIGISWPGDIPGVALDRLYYPEDEFSAFQAGVPVGRFLDGLRRTLGPDQKINIFAHSLGNVVVNTALTFLSDASGSAPITYVMNDAAVPAEAFVTAFDYTATPQDVVQHAGRLGFDPQGSQDAAWAGKWSVLQTWRDVAACPAGPDPELKRPPEPGWEECVAAKHWVDLYAVVHPQLKGTTSNAEELFFKERWSQVPNGGRVLNDRDRRGPWQGLFGSNLTKPRLKVVNTFNPNDHVLRLDKGYWGEVSPPLVPHAWYACQWSAKPYAFPLGIGEAKDDYGTLWALLLGTSTERVVDQLTTRLSLGADAPRQTRQWAELAFWFPAASTPAGASGIGGTINLSMVDIGGASGPGPNATPSHSYLWIEPFHKVWAGYVQIRDQFR